MQEWIGIGTQLALAFAAIYYTYETANLRKQASLQLDVLKKQHKVAAAPYIVIGSMPKSSLIQILESHDPREIFGIEDEKEAQDKFKEFKDKMNSYGDVFHCQMTNPTSKMALSVDSVHYNHASRNFIEAQNGVEVLGGKNDTVQTWMHGNAWNQDEAVKEFSQKYIDTPKMSELLSYEDMSYVAVFFRDIEGGVYCVKRRYKIDQDGDVGFKPAIFESLT